MKQGIAVCQSADLEEGGKGVRFPLMAGGGVATGFVLRHHGAVYAYLNRCAHLPLELDQGSSVFRDSSGGYLMCAKHGAIYQPENGRCAGGPCRGGRLHVLVVEEIQGQVIWYPDEFCRLPIA